MFSHVICFESHQHIIRKFKSMSFKKPQFTTCHVNSHLHTSLAMDIHIFKIQIFPQIKRLRKTRFHATIFVVALH